MVLGLLGYHESSDELSTLARRTPSVYAGHHQLLLHTRATHNPSPNVAGSACRHPHPQMGPRRLCPPAPPGPCPPPVPAQRRSPGGPGHGSFSSNAEQKPSLLEPRSLRVYLALPCPGPPPRPGRPPHPWVSGHQAPAPALDEVRLAANISTTPPACPHPPPRGKDFLLSTSATLKRSFSSFNSMGFCLSSPNIPSKSSG